jgi:hypothetical protein
VFYRDLLFVEIINAIATWICRGKTLSKQGIQSHNLLKFMRKDLFSYPDAFTSSEAILLYPQV